MLSVNRSQSALYAERYSNLKITGTQFLAFRDVPDLIYRHVNGAATLDYGCGAGKSSAFLKSLDLCVDGVDINEKMVMQARQSMPTGNFQVLKNGRIPAEDEWYDFVFASWVLMEISSKEQLVATLSEVARVMKSGATFMAIVCSADFYNDDWLTENTQFEENKNLQSGCIVKMSFKEINLSLYDYFWSDDDYRQVIQEAGLNLVQVYHPRGKDDDGYTWVTEKLKSPFTIYIAKKN